MTTDDQSKRRWRTTLVVILSLVALYIFIAPAMLAYNFRSTIGQRISGSPLSATARMIDTVTYPAAQLAVHVRPYYEYWSYCGSTIAGLSPVPWDELHP